MLSQEKKQSIKHRIEHLVKTQEEIEEELKMLACMLYIDSEDIPTKLESFPYKKILKEQLHIVI